MTLLRRWRAKEDGFVAGGESGGEERLEAEEAQDREAASVERDIERSKSSIILKRARNFLVKRFFSRRK